MPQFSAGLAKQLTEQVLGMQKKQEEEEAQRQYWERRNTENQQQAREAMTRALLGEGYSLSNAEEYGVIPPAPTIPEYKPLILSKDQIAYAPMGGEVIARGVRGEPGSGSKLYFGGKWDKDQYDAYYKSRLEPIKQKYLNLITGFDLSEPIVRDQLKELNRQWQIEAQPAIKAGYGGIIAPSIYDETAFPQPQPQPQQNLGGYNPFWNYIMSEWAGDSQLPEAVNSMQEQQSPEIKTGLDGKKYIKQNGQWYPYAGK